MRTQAQNKHLDHLEDRIILDGKQGGAEAIKILKEMSKFLSGKPGPGVTVTTKWDGAPAVICGIDPSDGQFFVGTKSVFAKEPKICKTQSDVAKFYDGALANKLSDSLRYLPSSVKSGILQGDLMFTNDKRMETIDGERLITFRPNTITYAANPKTKLGKDIDAAKIGIVFHTKYTGASIAESTASFNVTKNDFTTGDTVWAERAEFQDASGVAHFSMSEKSKYEALIRRAEGSLQKSGDILNKIQTGKRTLQIDTEYMKFFNNYVKQGRQVPSVNQAMADFYKHMYSEYDKVAKKYKKPESVDKKVQDFLKIVNFLEDNKKQIYFLVATYMNLLEAKMMLVEKMKKIGQLKLFVDMTGKGDYEPTTPEGFVAIVNDRATKLIDRLEFSKLNFTVPKQWG